MTELISPADALNTDVIQCVVYGHDRGVYAGSGGTINVRDCIITNNSTYGVRKYGGGSAITITYSDVWNNGQSVHQKLLRCYGWSGLH